MEYDLDHNRFGFIIQSKAHGSYVLILYETIRAVILRTTASKFTLHLERQQPRNSLTRVCILCR